MLLHSRGVDHRGELEEMSKQIWGQRPRMAFLTVRAALVPVRLLPKFES